MSELKAFDIVVAEEGNGEGIVKYRRAVYDKSEADKVIAELEDCIRDYSENEKNLVIANLDMQRRELHHKYKRCLEMAKWCAAMSVDNQHNYKNFPTHKSKFRIEHYSKWYMRWLELAEKFKPNSTAQ